MVLYSNGNVRWLATYLGMHVVGLPVHVSFIIARPEARRGHPRSAFLSIVSL